MPELPEVETVTNSIKKHLIGKKFTSLVVNWKKTLHNFTPLDFSSKIKNLKIKNIYRRGKFIVIDLDKVILAVHLRMTGKLYVMPEIDPKQKHISAYLSFSDKYLLFEDSRKFGRFYLYESIDSLDDRLGIEPFSKEFDQKWLASKLKSKSRQMKQLLLDQSFVVGLGNIYADEALYLSKIHPLSKSDEVSISKIKKLHSSIIKVLKESIKEGGTTIRDYTYDYSYVGNYALKLNVYGKQDTMCPKCKTLIIKIKVAQRGTHICPKCQRL